MSREQRSDVDAEAARQAAQRHERDVRPARLDLRELLKLHAAPFGGLGLGPGALFAQAPQVRSETGLRVGVLRRLEQCVAVAGTTLGHAPAEPRSSPLRH